MSREIVNIAVRILPPPDDLFSPLICSRRWARFVLIASLDHRTRVSTRCLRETGWQPSRSLIQDMQYVLKL